MTEPPARDPLELTLERLTAQALDPRQRVGHLLLVLAAAAIAAGLGGLLISETAIPPRAIVGVSALLVLALAWLAYGVRVLWVRRPHLANRDIADARMAVLFTATFTAGAMVFGWLAGAGPMTGAAWFGLLMLALAMAMLIRASRRLAELQAMRARLERPE